jgi:serine/threonine protein kinase
VHNLLPEKESHSVSQIREGGINQITEQIVVHDSMIPFEEIELGPQVGEGSYALVHKAKFKTMEVAVKMVRPPTSALNAKAGQKELLEFKREAMLMCQRSLVHPNIVLVMGLCDLEDGTLAIVTEFCEVGVLSFFLVVATPLIVFCITQRGSLADCLEEKKNDLPYRLRLRLMFQAVQGMLFLHNHSPPIIHRDLKSANLLLTQDFVVKVADFGLSRPLYEPLQHKIQRNKRRLEREREREKMSSHSGGTRPRRNSKSSPHKSKGPRSGRDGMKSESAAMGSGGAHGSDYSRNGSQSACQDDFDRSRSTSQDLECAYTDLAASEGGRQTSHSFSASLQPQASQSRGKEKEKRLKAPAWLPRAPSQFGSGVDGNQDLEAGMDMAGQGASVLGKKGSRHYTRNVGTMLWAAPELLVSSRVLIHKVRLSNYT